MGQQRWHLARFWPVEEIATIPDAATSALIKEWSDLSLSRFGSIVGIGVANISDNPECEGRQIGFHMQTFEFTRGDEFIQWIEEDADGTKTVLRDWAPPPSLKVNSAVLAIWLDSSLSPGLIDLSHEIAHGVLTLRGLQVPYSKELAATCVNSWLANLLHHRVIFAEQKSNGQDPTPSIDSAAKSFADAYNQLINNHSELERTLLFADMAISCSEEMVGVLQRAMKDDLTVLRDVNALVKLSEKYTDFTSSSQYESFGRDVLSYLTLGDIQWIDEGESLHVMLAALRVADSGDYNNQCQTS